MNNNLDENMIKNIKNMVENGNISDAISQIPPEMIQNFSNLMKNSSTQKSASTDSEKIHTTNSSSTSNFSNQSTIPDFSNIDMDTIMKISSALSQMNNKNDPRANLLYSLKPYLRDEKKNKIDQYANLLNITKIANIINNDKKENS